ncbi:S49 family peptidase [Methylobacterium sp. Leaf99]|uniref:S49 family peptidase n=1 Tax=Methylobacterium sp. Leaf99 TaxID=1736251 RepID=UPI000A7F34A9|nr:S49 family peptidase [Methylobacterium sp. Leaf99]
MSLALTVSLASAWAMEKDALAKLFEIVSREPSPVALEAYRSQALARAERASVRDGVAIISAEGPLFKRANFMTEFFGATSYDVLRRDLQAAVDNGGVRAILLNIDSPGGEAAGIGELAAAVKSLRGQGKPIVAYVGDLGASAAYWLASAADSIVVGTSAALGSIGVRASYADTSARDERSGVRRYDFVSSQSPYKVTDLQSDDGRARVQARVDTLAQVFIETVAENRGVTVDRVLAAFGQGDVLIGRAAVDAGMADTIGTFEGTLAALAAGKVISRPPPVARPIASSVPVRLAPVKPLAPPPSAAVVAERTRARGISALTPAGAEADRDEAIRSGMSVEAFRGVLAARSIIAAVRLARGER